MSAWSLLVGGSMGRPPSGSNRPLKRSELLGAIEHAATMNREIAADLAMAGARRFQVMKVAQFLEETAARGRRNWPRRKQPRAEAAKEVRT